MNSYRERIRPGAALRDPDGLVLDRTALLQQVDELSARLQPHLHTGAIVGLLADNSPDWAIADLALQELGLVSIPIPGFFTPAQMAHLFAVHDLRALLVPAAMPTFAAFGAHQRHELGDGCSLALCRRDGAAGLANHPAGCSKLTFTSGSTGAPKGIALTAVQQWRVAESLALALGDLAIERHLAMLPMSVLLENVAGLYTGLLLGAEVILPRCSRVGLSGSSAFDARKAIAAIAETGAQSLILLPQMLREITSELQRSGQVLEQLLFVAVGGGKVSSALIREAHAAGLPVFEGYGLSEAASVVSLNLPGAQRIGSVGRPLSHQQVTIAADGEIRIRAGNADGWSIAGDAQDWFATGDLGEIDAEGFLHVTGRKKNVLITGFGRNVSPEWPESVLAGCREVRQAFVYGEGQESLSALIVPAQPDTDVLLLQAAVDRANRELPDYARIARWHCVREPFTYERGLLTANGRPRRDRISQHHAELMHPLLKGEV